jgi:hypothetical protein
MISSFVNESSLPISFQGKTIGALPFIQKIVLPIYLHKEVWEPSLSVVKIAPPRAIPPLNGLHRLLASRCGPDFQVGDYLPWTTKSWFGEKKV